MRKYVLYLQQPSPAALSYFSQFCRSGKQNDLFVDLNNLNTEMLKLRNLSAWSLAPQTIHSVKGNKQKYLIVIQKGRNRLLIFFCSQLWLDRQQSICKHCYNLSISSVSGQTIPGSMALTLLIWWIYKMFTVQQNVIIYPVSALYFSQFNL